jgi:hypothetical protein
VKYLFSLVEDILKVRLKQEEDEDMSEAKRARMGEAAPLMWDQFAEENKEDDFFFTGDNQKNFVERDKAMRFRP